MALTTQTWSLVVKKKYFTSTEFKALDTAVKAYLLDKSTLDQLRARFSAWNKKFTDVGQTYKDSDRYIAGGALDDIAALIAPKAPVVVNMGSLATQAVSLGGGGLKHIQPKPPSYKPPPKNTGATVSPLGWTYVAYDATNPQHNWAGALTAPQTMDFSKTARINEAFMRTKEAIKMARDVMIKFPRTASGWNVPSPDQTSYVDYFGPFDSARFLRVLDNFRVLALAFEQSPNVIDIRGTVSGGNCYAACIPANLKTTANGSLALTGKVNVFLGNSFFNDAGPLSQKYFKSTDSTLVTLIHEFSHGSWRAVDAPLVNPGGTAWTLQPMSMDPNNVNYGSSPDGWTNQSSQEPDDKRLAAFAPDIAARNADNYGQFTRELLMRRKG